jgi:hypothetical protein
MTSVADQPIIRLTDRQLADAGEITFIGTATTVISIAGFSILTDPNFLHQGDRA